MKCDVCKGACCETFALPAGQLNPPDADTLFWILLHSVRREVTPGEPSLWNDWAQFECKCLELDENGKCSIYNDPRRPQLCADFPVGEIGCLTAVAERRTPEQYQEIRDETDPVTLERKES